MSQFSKFGGGSALLLCAILGGCSDIYFDRRDTIALSAGDALASNSIAQMVDPWPPHSANKNIAFNGEKMQSAIERYRQNRVIRPINATTSSAAYSAQASSAPPPAPAASAAPPPPPSPPPSFASSSSNSSSSSSTTTTGSGSSSPAPSASTK